MQEYDLIFSLGGSCASTAQLRKLYNLQLKSLPFDWLYHTTSSTLQNITETFTSDFKGWLGKSTLIPVSDEMRRESGTEFQYCCTKTGFWYIHNFTQPIDNYSEYKKNAKYQRRIKRLYQFVQKSQNILMVIDTGYQIKPKDLYAVLQALNTRFPGKLFKTTALQFNSPEKASINTNLVSINSHQSPREVPDYFEKTTPWGFLSQIKLSEKGKRMQENAQ